MDKEISEAYGNIIRALGASSWAVKHAKTLYRAIKARDDDIKRLQADALDRSRRISELEEAFEDIRYSEREI